MVQIKSLSFIVNSHYGNKDASKEEYKELCLRKGKTPKVSTNKDIDKKVRSLSPHRRDVFLALRMQHVQQERRFSCC